MSPQPTTLHPPDRVIALIDLVKCFRWPAVALAVMTLAATPLGRLLAPEVETAPRTVMAGGLALRIDAASLPAAPAELVETLRGLDAGLLCVFLDMDQAAICCGALVAEHRVGMRRLAHLNVVEQRFEPQHGPDCAQNSVMTEHGRRVQTSLISLTVSLLKG